MSSPSDSWAVDLVAAPLPKNEEEVKTWLKRYRIDEVECLMSDIAGIARGKAMPAKKFADLKPSYLANSIFYQSITGDYVDIEGMENQWMEKDVMLVPDIATMRPLPWAKEPTVQVIHDLEQLEGGPVETAPRNVLKRIVQLYTDKGWKAVVAPELEFYLTAMNKDPNEALEAPIGRSGRQSISRQAYSMSAVDEYETIIDDIYDFAEAQGLEIDTITQEGGAAQLEINLDHGDPVELADQVFFFKRLIREAALRHNCYATFMAKPMDDEPGSAMHLHHSVVDIETGKNIFSNEDGSETDLFRWFIGGQQHYAPGAMVFYAPYVNSYRRVAGGWSAPANVEWSHDNRTVGLRIPNSGPAARRVENRVVGADANGYLALAASLACGYLGMMGKIEPREECTEDASERPTTLPSSLQRAIDEFGDVPELQEILSQEFSDLYKAIKLHELEEFLRVISPWEREHLLLTV